MLEAEEILAGTEIAMKSIMLEKIGDTTQVQTLEKQFTASGMVRLPLLHLTVGDPIKAQLLSDISSQMADISYPFMVTSIPPV